ncbi:B-cell receptor CD22-like, partial [Saccoglossus kowalevskii]
FEEGEVPDVVVWYYDANLISEDRDVLTPLNEYNITGTENAYNLRIYNIALAQEGEYGCGDKLFADLRVYAFMYVIDSRPQCKVYPGATVITENTVTLNCTMDLDASAPGDLVWYQNGVEVMRKTGIENTWTTFLYKDNNGDVFDCQLEHYTLPRPKWSQVSCEDKIVMDVQFDPILEISVTGDVDESGNEIEGDSFVMTCFVLEANPDVETFLWFNQNQNVISNEQSILADSFPRNSPTVNIGNQTYVTVIEGDTYIAECLVDSNPVVEGIWIHSDGSFSPGPILEIENISRTDSGTYTCFAETVFWDESTASDMDSMYINVQYPANISFAGSTNVYEGSDVILLCATTDANPRPYEMYINHTDDNDNDNVVAEVKYDLHILYIITSISEEHSGTYTCYATTRFHDGTIGKSTSDEIAVNVLQCK